MDIFDSLPANLARVEDEVSDCTSFGVGGICLHPTIAYLEADVRRNGRNEARREVTLPWFQEEGSQPSQLGGYRIILF